MAVEIKLSDGTTLRTGTHTVPGDLVRAFRDSEQAFVAVDTEDGETFNVNPEQVVYIRTVR